MCSISTAVLSCTQSIIETINCRRTPNYSHIKRVNGEREKKRRNNSGAARSSGYKLKTKRCVGQLLLSAKWNLRFMLKRENTRIITWNQNVFAPQASGRQVGRQVGRQSAEREETKKIWASTTPCTRLLHDGRPRRHRHRQFRTSLFHLLTEFPRNIVYRTRTVRTVTHTNKRSKTKKMPV